MASLSNTKRKGKSCYQIWLGNSDCRRNLWLGAISKSSANQIFSFVQQLETSVETGIRPSRTIQEWLKSIDHKFYLKLERVGLVKTRVSSSVAEFFRERLAKLDCASRTRDIYQRAHDKFLDYLNEDCELREVTTGLVHDFYYVYLVELEMAESYRCKTAKIIREFFDKALKFELIDRNPWDGIKIVGHVERSKHSYIDRESLHQIITKGTDSRWRCVIAFAALCGLRTRCEIAAISWENIHWDDKTMTIPKAKTRERMCPIFGDFRPYLEEYHASLVATDPLNVVSGPVFPNLASQTQLTNRLNKTVIRAGYQPWKKPWMNLRSSCESHLITIRKFDIETVCEWLGNSPDIARKHYLQMTCGNVERAAAMKKFSNSFQHEGDSESTVSEKPVFLSMPEHENAAEYTRRDSNP